MKTKICTKCGKRKSLSGFYKDSTKKDGLKPYCKDCANEMNNNYYKNRNAKKTPGKEVMNHKPKKEELEAVIFVSNMIESVVRTIAGNYGLEAVCMVKLKAKTK